MATLKWKTQYLGGWRWLKTSSWQSMREAFIPSLAADDDDDDDDKILQISLHFIFTVFEVILKLRV